MKKSKPRTLSGDGVSTVGAGLCYVDAGIALRRLAVRQSLNRFFSFFH
jgi:hypothetical protein